MARVGGDDGGPGEVVPTGHSVEQRARGGETPRGAGERRDEGVVGAHIGAGEGGEEGERVRERSGVGGEQVEDAIGEERGGRPERGGRRSESARGRGVGGVGSEEREEAIDGVVELRRRGHRH